MWKANAALIVDNRNAKQCKNTSQGSISSRAYCPPRGGYLPGMHVNPPEWTTQKQAYAPGSYDLRGMRASHAQRLRLQCLQRISVRMLNNYNATEHRNTWSSVEGEGGKVAERESMEKVTTMLRLTDANGKREKKKFKQQSRRARGETYHTQRLPHAQLGPPQRALTSLLRSFLSDTSCVWFQPGQTDRK